MFEHSIPVPRLYRAASKITENVSKKEDSVKNLIYQAKHPVSNGVMEKQIICLSCLISLTYWMYLLLFRIRKHCML